MVDNRATTLQPVLETALDAVVVMSPDGLVADWNEVAEQTFGWSRTEAVGRNLADLIIPESFRGAHWEGLQRYLATGEGPVLRRRIEVSALHKEGREFPVELSITPTEEAGQLIFVGFLRDITDRRLSQRLLEVRARDAELLFRITAFAAETGSFDEALATCLQTICAVTGWPIGHVFVAPSGGHGALTPTAIWHPPGPDEFDPLRRVSSEIAFARGIGMPGRILASGEPEWMSHADTDPAFLRGEVARAVGVKAAFGFPLKVAGEVVAVLEFFSAEHAPPDHDLLLTVRTIGEQVGRVLERRQAEERLREEKRALEHEIGERRRVEAHQQLLLGELDHRVKNTLAVVTGMASQTARASRSIEEFRASFLDRLSSLSRAHGLLTAHHWESTALRALAEEILSSYVRAARPQVTITGPELLLAPKEAMAMSMILHELITNATKHGALTTPEGRIEVSWDVGPAAHGAEVTFRWRETGVAGPGRPLRKGFGTKLIEASARMELGGSSSVEWRPDGLEQVINFPAQTRGGA